MTPAALALELAGETVHLLAGRALWWPREALLMVADVHFGKAAAFRAAGVAVPRGSTAANLLRLDALLAAHPARQLVFLGDFLHARSGRAPGTLAALHQWRERHAGLALTLVRGNHDRHAGDPPAELRVVVHPEPWLVGPFALQHAPAPHPTHHVLAGHVHPVARLAGPGRERLRLPCFCLDRGVTTLPAFGEFTGGFEVEREPWRRLAVVGDGGVWLLPAARR